MAEKKKMGRPPADTEPVMIRMSRDMIRALDEARRDVEDLPTRPELVRRIVSEWLAERGVQV
ncbi:ribbon-helix-helix protein, CopG family [Frigidibacter sp. MR17.24]|uniref:ribbon-helix-helix protein, CopG family n=1 Tax=Frigidibacter sp. MR17.24 TaxID=3127345 RepID=UPI003012B76B